MQGQSSMEHRFVLCPLTTVLILLSNSICSAGAIDYPCASAFSSFPFCNTLLPTPARVKDLVSRLTLDDKVLQLVNSANGVARLGIPRYEWWSEALHGVSNIGPGTKFEGTIPAAVSFPQVILTAATFNPSLWRSIGEVISTEARAMYNTGQSGLTYWSPNINIFRDPRWGRGQETPGEDPLVASMYAVNFVQGLQSIEGGDPEKSLKVGACCKHFSAYDVDQWEGIDRFHFDAEVTEQDMQDTFLPPFQACVEQGDVACVMCSYNRINGVPACADKKLLTDVVRKQWGLDGYIASDCDSVKVMYEDLHYTRSPQSSVADSILAGLNLNCGDYLSNFTEGAVKAGLLKEEDVDESLAHLYTTLMRLGYFNGDPRQQKWGALGAEHVCTEEHRALSLEAAKQGIVLLKNQGNALPLSKQEIKTVAVIGPNANDATMMIGNYAGVPCRNTTPLRGIAAYVDVLYHHGCGGGVACNETSEHDMAAAVAMAARADAVVLVMGLDQTQEHESFDRSSLLLPGQQAFITSMVAAVAHGPVILVIMSGGPVDISFAHASPSIDSILWAGYPGEAGGEALAAILFGDHNPAGRLPNTWYRESYTLWPMTDMHMRPNPTTGYPGRTYRFHHDRSSILYEFGHGLSYTSFSTNLRIINTTSPSTSNDVVTINIRTNQLSSNEGPNANPTCLSSIAPNIICGLVNVANVAECPMLQALVDVQNHGDMDSHHAILLMWHPPHNITNMHHALGAPTRQLLGFQHIWIPARQSIDASFLINACQHFSVLAPDGITRVIPLGTHTLSIPSISSSSRPMATLTFTVAT